ncbi:hypothetical protein QN219_32910 [Sinorhizobium sp. 7-81]|uniref:hypothetical protein n=1 Tax=Sinorhizobium sp. 8-89 TaxID=3049089 RepID=UPI0024C23C27|nr:hypothetical protein [Sinorhizobium sp. 8-89]MDK1494715.1 hypothetical protein [Sinorhizobium sp. 8-89]
MTQELNRIEIDLVPLQLFSRRISEGWTMVPGHPLQMPPDYPSGPNNASEAHLMTFSVMPRETIVPRRGHALHARTSAFTLFVTGTLFGLSFYSLELVRLVEDFEEFRLWEHSVTIH